MSGPLAGLKIIEISGVGPGPFCGMLLADMGADVIRVEKQTGNAFAQNPDYDYLNRGKRCIGVNLKSEEGRKVVLKLAETADGMFEGFRPGVAEKLGIGPDEVMAVNPKLVYGRMTGWGQDGPLSQTAGHDINYISLSGALHATGLRGAKPTVPLSLVGDFGGGGLILAYGMMCALFEASKSGQGQVVDSAMFEGAATLMTSFFGAQKVGFWKEERGTNMLDSGAHFYDTYECADGEYVSVGAIEGPFYAALIEGLGLSQDELPNQMDMERWPAMTEKFAAIFKTKTRDEWAEVFADKDACVSPILKMSELKSHPHIQARESLIDLDGHIQPAPAPKFSRTPASVKHQAAHVGEHTDAILSEIGLTADEVATLKASGGIV